MHYKPKKFCHLVVQFLINWKFVWNLLHVTPQDSQRTNQGTSWFGAPNLRILNGSKLREIPFVTL